MPEKIEKAVCTTVEVLLVWCKPVKVRERPNKAVLTSEEMLQLVKNVEVCLVAREDRESSFHSFWGPVRLVQACLCAGKT